MSDDHRELESLLSAERARPEPAAAVKSAVAAKVAATLGATALGGGVAVGVATAAAASASAKAGAGASVTAAAGAGIALKVALGVLLGGVIGGAIVAVTLPPRVIVQTREVGVEVPGTGPSAAIAAATAPSTTIVVSPVAPSASVAPGAPSARPPSPPTSTSSPGSGSITGGHDVDLARERALVDRARSALARGDAAGAIGAAEEHRKAFPRGQLAEEREVVAIQGLAAAGRSEEAANRAGAFRKAYPSSLLLPIVDAALRPR